MNAQQLQEAAGEINTMSKSIADIIHIVIEMNTRLKVGKEEANDGTVFSLLSGAVDLCNLISLFSDRMCGDLHGDSLERFYCPSALDGEVSQQSGGGQPAKPVEPSTIKTEKSYKRECSIKAIDDISLALFQAKGVLMSLQSNDNFETLLKPDIAASLFTAHELVVKAENQIDAL